MLFLAILLPFLAIVEAVICFEALSEMEGLWILSLALKPYYWLS